MQQPTRNADFRDAIRQAHDALVTRGVVVDPGRWQGVPTEGRPDLQTVEVENVAFTVKCPLTIGEAQQQIEPNLPWADDHFTERVGRVPSNPGEAYKSWPWWRGQDKHTKTDTLASTPEGEGVVSTFTHTYQERFWPKEASESHREWGTNPLYGIRYDYGDLDDLVNLLLIEPYTRQAYIPIFFPEDTGAVHGGRIPCTLGYHFMLRRHRLHMWYFIRSCDYVRHFRDDLYLAVRLLLWVLDELADREGFAQDPDETWRRAQPGEFTFVCPSLHYHRGDGHLVRPR